MRLLVAALFGLSLTLAACGGSDDTSTSAPDPDEEVDAAESDDASTDSQVEPAAGIGEEGIDLSGPVNPLEVSNLIQALTGSAPTDDENACLVDRSTEDSLLTEVFNGFATPTYQLTPEGFTALAVNTHACVSRDTLIDSLGSLSVLEGEGNAALVTTTSGEVLLDTDPLGGLPAGGGEQAD